MRGRFLLLKWMRLLVLLLKEVIAELPRCAELLIRAGKNGAVKLLHLCSELLSLLGVCQHRIEYRVDSGMFFAHPFLSFGSGAGVEVHRVSILHSVAPTVDFFGLFGHFSTDY